MSSVTSDTGDSRRSLDGLPRGRRAPIVGGFFHYLRDPLAYLEESATRGDVVQLDFFRKRAFLVSDPALIDQVLVKNPASFRKDVFMQGLKTLLGEGLLGSEGEFWKRQRRLIQPAFHREHIARYASIMVSHASRAVERWRASAERGGAVIDAHHELMVLAADIVTECLFGSTVGDASEVGKCLESVMERFGDPMFLFVPQLAKVPLPVNRRYAEAAARLDRIVRDFISRRRALGADAPSDDLLAMLLAAQDEDGSRMSDTQVRDEVLILFLAGHETTALALGWTLFELSEHPEVERELHAELVRVLGDRVPTFADLPELKTTSHVVHEGLRLHPPAWSIGREAIAPVEIGGRRFEAGAWLWFLPWVVHRDARWYADPLAFRPERWADGLAKRLPKMAYLPFGGGPRVCIGNQFALMEATLLLATIARRVRLRAETPSRVAPKPSITLRFAHGLRMVVTPQTSSP
jgi:cytochrome P450